MAAMLPAGTGGQNPRPETTPTQTNRAKPGARRIRSVPASGAHEPPVEYVTAAQVHERWPDVRPQLLRLWVHRGLLDVVRGPDGHPVRAKGGANIYRWHEVVAAERRARQNPSGRPRAG